MSKNPRIPEAAFEFRHRVPLQIRFNDIDVFGHLNNSVYIQFMDLGKSEYFRGLLPDGRFDPMAVGLVVANINCDFYAPTRMEEQLEVLTAVASIANKSLVLEQRVVNRATGEVKCRALSVMVSFDPRSGASEPVSEEWRARIAAFEQREFKSL